MQILNVEVAQDHIDSLSKAKKPIFGIAELIWNSVDADATDVKVRLNRNSLNAIEIITVIDNGLGITMDDAREGFGHLGGSWKKLERQSRRDKRILHGKQGQGRYRAFAVCERAEWESVYLSNGSLREFKIIGTAQNKRQFTITDEKQSELTASVSNSEPAREIWLTLSRGQPGSTTASIPAGLRQPRRHAALIPPGSRTSSRR